MQSEINIQTPRDHDACLTHVECYEAHTDDVNTLGSVWLAVCLQFCTDPDTVHLVINLDH